MNKQILWLFFVLLIGYLALVFCDENNENIKNALQKDIRINDVQNGSTELFDEARTRRRHKLFHLFWGWHALAIAYWIKVKVIIVSFFLGSAVFLGLRYFWPHKCSSAITHEGPIIYENPHSFSHHHDHIPYSYDHADHFEHSFDSSSFEPYSGYAGAYSDTAPSSVAASGPPDAHSIKRRSLDSIEHPRQALSMEEKIAEVMFSFLGLDSKACRRRFICEMEFRSKLNPLSSMAFRIVGRGFFDKYTNSRNTNGRATSFQECAAVNPDCVFIEDDEEQESAHETLETTSTETANTSTSNENHDSESSHTSEENTVDAEKSSMETENAINILNERKHVNKRRRMHKKMNDVAERLFARQI